MSNPEGDLVFGSQALETAIGLALMFFVIATASSAVVEFISRLWGKRSADLEKTIKHMLAGQGQGDADLERAWQLFSGTSVYAAAREGAGKALVTQKRRPSYLSAKAFADATLEMIVDGDRLLGLDELPKNLRKRLDPLVRQTRGELVEIRAGLESWFDETMSRAEGAYKRWVTVLLFCVGLVFAIAGNASTTVVADDLWHNSVVRQSVVDAAGQVAAKGEAADELISIAEATSKMQQFSLPVGWDSQTRSEWDSGSAWTWHRTASVAGWLLTALLVMLGGPFWFDLLSKFVSLRSSGTKPLPAADDDTSATTAQRSLTAPSTTGESGAPAINVSQTLAAALGVEPPPPAAAAPDPQ
ncbi:hypothetical protein [Kribbella sp. NPDC006257]|uniref:hypothetical protein n=1 Tax=Kribbella sp. NPDC006257 TaxID=3156738 RepID=UPI0033AA7E01